MTHSHSMNTLKPSTESPSDTAICQHLGVIAGEGELPIESIKTALSWGLAVTAYTPDNKAYKPLVELLGKARVRRIGVGTLEKTYKILKADGIDAIIAAGKVNKWVLLKNPNFDKRALKLFNAMKTRSDDNVMHALIADVESEGFRVLPQKLFLESLFIAEGIYTERHPNAEEQGNIELALQTAREIARLDIGQSAVVSKGMVIALEAIEGTDKAISRAKEWIGKRGGVVAKVEKPDQDHRFDIPTVGPRTIQTMRKAGLDILVIEARKTLVLELTEVIRLANRWNMIVLSV